MGDEVVLQPTRHGAPGMVRHTTELGLVPVEETSAFRGLRRLIFASVAATAVLASGTGYLMARTVIAGAVVANGVLVVETGAKKVQSAIPGTVEELLVREDERVEAGQPLLALDRTVARSRLLFVETRLVQQKARLARLTAERDELQVIPFPETFDVSSLNTQAVRAVLESETMQFELRRKEREGRQAQLREQIAQEREAIEGRNAQLKASSEAIALVEKELSDLYPLFKKKLIRSQRLTEMQRELSELTGLQGEMKAAIASGRGRIAELELQVAQVGQTLRASLTDDIATVHQTIAELVQDQIATRDILARSVLHSPQSGIVHDLALHTLGGVVQPAEVLMLIVPENDRLVGEARIRPNDIDQIYPGQEVTLQFSAFDRGTTPALTGKLSSVSPDLSTDPQTGAMYYTARVAIDPGEMDKLGDLRVVPGMPMELYIRTTERTLLSYLTKPLSDQMNRALR